MNNRHFYSLIALASLLALLFETRAMQQGGHYATFVRVMNELMCGVALYYAYNRFRKRKRVNFLLILLVLLAILINPIVPLPFPLSIRIIVDLTAPLLFYWAASEAKVHDAGIVTHKVEDEETDEVS